MREATNTLRLFRKSRIRVITDSGAALRCGWAVCALVLVLVPAALAQSAETGSKKTPLDLVLRSIAVLEWSGPLDKPTTSLLVPVAIYTDGRYLDSGDYLAQPVPFAVENHTQYVLEQSGMAQGFYDLTAAGEVRGNWFAAGSWASHRDSGAVAAAVPVQNPSPATKPPSGEHLPVLHLRPKIEPGAPKPDPNKPVMSYGKLPQPALTYFSNAALLHRQQIVAVYDAANRSARPLRYAWKDANEKAAMQQKVEAWADSLLQQFSEAKQSAEANSAQNSATGDTTNPDKHPKLVKRPDAAAVKLAAKKTQAAAPTPKLSQTDLRCFTLGAPDAGGATPTCVFTGDSAVEGEALRYVTVIEQPDISGSPSMVSQSVTDATQLDTHPRVQLVDAVDAKGDQNAELLFEIDGATWRQLALYQVSAAKAGSDAKVKLAFVTAKLPF